MYVLVHRSPLWSQRTTTKPKHYYCRTKCMAYFSLCDVVAVLVIVILFMQLKYFLFADPGPLQNSWPILIGLNWHK